MANEQSTIKDPKIQELSDLLSKAKKKDKVLVIDHPYGDPDSIASKYGIRYMLKTQFELDVDLAYANEVSHFQNKGLIKELDSSYGFQALPIESVKFGDYTFIVCVDFNLNNSNLPFPRSLLEEIPPEKFLVIDHHKKSSIENEVNPYFEDIIEVGICSTSTRIVEYIQTLGIKLESETDEQKLIATALSMGIENDALSSGGKKKRDRQALSFLGDAINTSLERKLTRISRSSQAQDAIAEGMKSRRKMDIYCIGSAGVLTKDNRDAIPELANQLLVEAGIEVAIAYGVVEDKIDISFRALDTSSLSAGNFAKKFEGGGRPDAAGAQIPLGPFSEYPSDKETQEILMRCIEDILIIPKLKEITG